MTFSIVIPSYRRDDLLLLCLQSVVAHAPARTQILVVDDGSPHAIISRTANRFPNVQVFRHKTSRGFCHAANTGIQAATGDIIELLNDDTQVTSGWADAALCWFRNPIVGAVAPLVLQSPASDPAIIDTAGDEYDFGGFARKRGHGQAYGPGGPYSHPCEVWGVSAAAGFYRRDAIVRAGGFPNFFRAYFEDVDLSFRIRNLGFTIRYEPRSVVWHQVSASYGRTPNSPMIEQQSRNEELVFCRNVSRTHWPRHLAVLGGKAIRRAREGTLRPWVRGRVMAWQSCWRGDAG